MILHTQPSKRWTEHDFLLLEAYQILEDERCPQCGLPKYICHNESNIIQFEVDEDTCAAKVEVERHEEFMRRTGGEDYKQPEGTIMRPRPIMTNGEEFVTMREPYYRDLAAYLDEPRE